MKKIKVQDIRNHYSHLKKMWKKISPNDYQKVNSRLINSIEAINLEKNTVNLNVLDIGSNAGLISIVAAQKFNFVNGVERYTSYHKKAILSKRYFNKKGYKINNVKFFNMEFIDYIKNGYHKENGINAVVGFQVLYHLNNKDISALEKVLTNSNLAIFGTKKSRGRSNNSLDLRNIKTVKKFLQKNGFLKIAVLNRTSNYSTVIGWKFKVVS